MNFCEPTANNYLTKLKTDCKFPANNYTTGTDNIHSMNTLWCAHYICKLCVFYSMWHSTYKASCTYWKYCTNKDKLYPLNRPHVLCSLHYFCSMLRSLRLLIGNYYLKHQFCIYFVLCLFDYTVRRQTNCCWCVCGWTDSNKINSNSISPSISGDFLQVTNKACFCNHHVRPS